MFTCACPQSHTVTVYCISLKETCVMFTYACPQSHTVSVYLHHWRRHVLCSHTRAHNPTQSLFIVHQYRRHVLCSHTHIHISAIAHMCPRNHCSLHRTKEAMFYARRMTLAYSQSHTISTHVTVCYVWLQKRVIYICIYIYVYIFIYSHLYAHNSTSYE
jgi:hypothetical protein